jgi:hypothetical protein
VQPMLRRKVINCAILIADDGDVAFGAALRTRFAGTRPMIRWPPWKWRSAKPSILCPGQSKNNPVRPATTKRSNLKWADATFSLPMTTTTWWRY